MGKKKRVVCMLLSMMLVLIAALPQPAKATEIYFTSVNDSLLPLGVDTMPLWSSGALYVPYTVFDRNTTGLTLDMNGSFDRSNNVVRIYNLKKMLSFNINTGECWDDITGKEYAGRAILRNGKPYVSLRTVCEVFDMTYSYTTMEQGYLVRIKDESVVLSDARFIDAAQNLIERRLREYNQSIAVVPPPSVSGEETTKKEENNNLKVDTYLAFTCETMQGMDKILHVLQEQDDLAVFFLRPELMSQEGDLIRRLLGQGHSIGVWAQGTTPEEVLEQVNAGNACLEETAFTRTTLVMTEDEFLSFLEQEGFVVWRESLRLEPSNTAGPNYFAGVVSQRLNGRTKNTYLTFEGGNNTARVLSAVLRQLEKEQYVVRIPLETRI